MKRSLFSLVLMFFVMNLQATGYTGNVNFFLGQKSLDSEDWGPLDKQAEIGVLVDFKRTHWPVSVALDFLVSADEATELGTNFEGSTAEFDVGIRKIFETPNGRGLKKHNVSWKPVDYRTC